MPRAPKAPRLCVGCGAPLAMSEKIAMICGSCRTVQTDRTFCMWAGILW